MVKAKYTIVLIEGPNLNKIENRGKIYQSKFKLNDIISKIEENFHLEYFQSSIEGEIVDKINSLIDKKISGIIINPGAYTHYSLAISDALENISCIKVEVHLTNLYKREKFRQKSITALNCDAVIQGTKNYGYYLASEYIRFNL